MSRPIVPVNFDNDEELFAYVNGRANRAEFIRYCIRKEMMEERKNVITERDIDTRIEKIVKKCLEEFQPSLSEVNKIDKEDESLLEAANFFDED